MSSHTEEQLVSEEEIAKALGCSVEEVRARAEREGWPYWLETAEGESMIRVEPVKRN